LSVLIPYWNITNVSTRGGDHLRCEQEADIVMMVSLLIQRRDNIRIHGWDTEILTENDLIGVQFTIGYGILVHQLTDFSFPIEPTNNFIDIDIMYRDKVGLLSGLFPLLELDDNSSSFIEQLCKVDINCEDLIVPEIIVQQLIMSKNYEALFQSFMQIINLLGSRVNIPNVVWLIWMWGDKTRLDFASSYYHRRSLSFSALDLPKIL
jgi:hypothetical protein